MPSIPLRPFDLGATNQRRPKPDQDFQDTQADADTTDTDTDSEVWRHSSLELEQGLDILEMPIDTLPDDLQDGLLPAPRKPA